MSRLSMKCHLAHWMACVIDRMEVWTAPKYHFQRDLGWLSRLKLRLGDYWVPEYMEKRCK